MLSFSMCSTETVSTHFGLMLSPFILTRKFSFSLKWRRKPRRAQGIDGYDLLIKYSETDEELGMETIWTIWKTRRKKPIIPSKESSPWDACLAFTPRLHLRSKIAMNPQNKDSTEMVVCPAPRHSAALTPQPAVLMTDVRICLISGDGS